MNSKSHQKLGISLFLIGLVLGTLLVSLDTFASLEANAFWGDPKEATFFASSLDTYTRLTTLICPLIVTSSSPGTIQTWLYNPSPKTIKPVIRAYFGNSNTTEARAATDKLSLQPHSLQSFHWVVDQQDIHAGIFLLVRVLVYEVYPSPSRTTSCGSLVLNLPILSSWLATFLVLLIIVGSLIIGGGFWWRSIQPVHEKDLLRTYGTGIYSGLVLAGLFTLLTGLRIITGFLFLGILLLGISLLSNALRQ